MSSHRCSDRQDISRLPNLAHGDRHPLHAIGYRVSHRIRTAIALVVIALLAFGTTTAASVYANVGFLVEKSQVKSLKQHYLKEESIIDPNAGKTITMLVMGQDTREGEMNAKLGAGVTDVNHQSDTTMVVQISADRSYINIVSIPRDSIVNAPSCNTTNGTMSAQYGVMFNSIFANAYAYGGDVASAASCTVNTVNSLTGLDISQFIVVDFAGLSSMIDALGGVDICIPEDIKDVNTGLDLARGLAHLDGVTATQYARVRHGQGTGDGSDIMRTTRQQYLIKALIKEATSKNLFTQTNQLYQLATTAIQSLKISDGLADVNTLAGLAAAMSSFDPSRIYAQTVPVADYVYNTNHVVWTDAADTLWEKIRNGQPLTIDDTANPDDTSGDAADAAPEANDGATQNPAQEDGTGANTDGTQQPTETLDPNTGLLVRTDGTLIDPDTGGYVDPESGVIHDINTGQSIGMADQYVEYTFCAIPAQK